MLHPDKLISIQIKSIYRDVSINVTGPKGALIGSRTHTEHTPLCVPIVDLDHGGECNLFSLTKLWLMCL